jgi:alpha-L-fucosidase
VAIRPDTPARTCASPASKDGKILYVIALGWPADGALVVKSLATGSATFSGDIGKVRLIGGSDSLTTTREKDGLHVQLPAQKPCASAYALAITLQ